MILVLITGWDELSASVGPTTSIKEREFCGDVRSSKVLMKEFYTGTVEGTAIDAVFVF